MLENKLVMKNKPAVLFPLLSTQSPYSEGFTHLYTVCFILDTDMHPYRECSPNFYDHDPSKKWYFDFYSYSKKHRKVKRHRVWIPKKGELRFRIIRAESMMREINQQLKKGYFVDDLKAPPQKPAKPTQKPDKNTAIFALQTVADLNPANVSVKSLSSYKTAIKKFSDFLKSKDVYHYPFDTLTHQIVLEFSDFMRINQKLQPKTINNIIYNLLDLNKHAVKRNLCSKNIFEGYEKMSVPESDRHKAYDDFQKFMIEEHLKQNDIDLYYVTRFIFHLFIRTSELRTLKISDIDFRKGSVMVWAGNSKNRKKIPIPINTNLQAILLEMKLYTYPRDFFVFGKNLKPSKESATINEYLLRHNKALIDLGIYVKNETTLYAWKHTGNVCAFLAGVDIWTLKDINRHWSIMQTEEYLRGLGLILKPQAKNLSW